MFDFLTFETLGYLILLVSLCIYLFKEHNKNSKTTIQKNDNKSDTENDKKKNIPEPIKKMMELIKILPQRQNELQNNHNSKIIAEKLNKNFKLENDADDTIYIPDDIYEDISKDLDSRLGSTISPLVRRVEKDGSIVLDMEAIRFITGEHIPLVTPTGAIRVMNFLTIEQDLEISILTGKPFFYRNSKTNTLEKLTSEQINKLILSDEFVNYSETINEKNEYIKSLSEDNNKQFDLLEERNNRLIKLEKENEKLKNQLEIMISINSQKNHIENQNIINKHEDIFNENESQNIINTVDIINHPANNSEFEEIEEQTVIVETIDSHESDFIKETIIEDKSNEPSSEMNLSDSINSVLKEQKEPIKSIVVEKDSSLDEKKLKIISEQNSKNVFNILFFGKGLLSNKYILNANITYDKLTYVSNSFNEYTKEFTLNFNEKNLLLEMKKIANNEGYLFIENSTEILFANRKIERLIAFFTDQHEKKMYSTNLIKIKFTEDELLGMMLSNKRYSDVFTKEQIETYLENEQRDVYKKMYKRRLHDISKGEYNVF